MTKRFKRIFISDLEYVQNISRPPDTAEQHAQAPWKWYFELKTRSRVYMLYAATEEERDLWVDGLHRIIKLPVKDPFFKPMGLINRE